MTESAAATDSNTDAPVCWICLEEGATDGLVRDCSCRGSSGHAHISCIIGWAETASTRGDSNTFMACPICKQPYQNELRHNLSKIRVKFVERKYSMKNAVGVAMHAGAIMNRMTLIDADKQADRREGREICNKLHHILEYTMTDFSRNWDQIQASAYMSIATFYLRMGMRFGYDEWKDCLQLAREYYCNAVQIYRHKKDELSVSAIEKMISNIDARIAGVEREVIKEEGQMEHDRRIEMQKYDFYRGQANLGENHIYTINAGVSFAQTLFDLYDGVNAERLATKLHEISLRAHGVDHNCTVNVSNCLQRIKERRVWVKSRPNEIFQALRFEECNVDDDGDGQTRTTRLVLQGPILTPRNVDKEQTFHEDCANISYVPGTVVMMMNCSQKLEHLNGKIGTVSKCNKYYEIRFQDVRQDGRYEGRAFGIKETGLRIVFDLPDADAYGY